MAEIVLNVDLRDTSGTGAARATRRDFRVPGILYGGERGPVSISVPANEFRKALYTGKLLGHLVTLKYGKETQPVIAKDVQFHPVSDEPIHFDLYRVEENQRIRIAITVHFRNQETSPGLKRGGTLNVARHEVEVWAPAAAIPEELVADLNGLDIGDSVRVSNLLLPEGVEPIAGDAESVVATVTMASSMVADEEAEGEAAGEDAKSEG